MEVPVTVKAHGQTVDGVLFIITQFGQRCCSESRVGGIYCLTRDRRTTALEGVPVFEVGLGRLIVF